MNLSYLETLLAVRDMGSFSAAARHIGLTQPAVSLQIQSLEEELGAQLIIRNARNCELTPAGLAVAGFAEEVFGRLRHTKMVVSKLTGEVSGPVSIGASTIPGEYILPQLLAGFRYLFPEVELHLTIGDSDSIADAIEAKRLDLGVIGSRPKGSRLRAIPWCQDELLVTVPLGHPWAGKTISPAELTEYPFVSREEGSGTRRTYEAALRSIDFSPELLDTAFTTGSSISVLTAVACDMGFAFCSKWALHQALQVPAVATARVEGLDTRRSLYLVALPDHFRTRAADELLKHLEHGAELRI